MARKDKIEMENSFSAEQQAAKGIPVRSESKARTEDRSRRQGAFLRSLADLISARAVPRAGSRTVASERAAMTDQSATTTFGR